MVTQVDVLDLSYVETHTAKEKVVDTNVQLVLHGIVDQGVVAAEERGNGVRTPRLEALE